MDGRTGRTDWTGQTGGLDGRTDGRTGRTDWTDGLDGRIGRTDWTDGLGGLGDFVFGICSNRIYNVDATNNDV